LVAVVELLSPSNKVENSDGRSSYLSKREEILSSSSHWVELDLLRTGRPTVPNLTRFVPAPYDYIVRISPAGRPRELEWPIALSHRLPVVHIPLTTGDKHVLLDVQQALDLVYDRSGYDAMIDYRKPSRVPLTKEQGAWADELLKAKGLR
jgi:Protein of unknown function (DUF4058)